jgi:hypothetical protein
MFLTGRPSTLKKETSLTSKRTTTTNMTLCSTVSPSTQTACRSILISSIATPTFFPDLHAEFPDLLEYPPFTATSWADWEILHNLCRHQEEQARQVRLAESHHRWVEFLEQNGQPVPDHLQAGPSRVQCTSLYTESDLLSDYNHDRTFILVFLYTPLHLTFRLSTQVLV